MLIKNIFMGICGLSFGCLSSAGVFTVLVSVGLIPRFAGKFHIAGKILILEEMVVLGTLTGCFFSVFSRFGEVGDAILRNEVFGQQTEAAWSVIANIFLIAYGLFAGMFVGCLALAIAEMLDSIPILARRIGFRHGLGIVILAVALGKLTGSLIYFSQAVFLYGGT